MPFGGLTKSEFLLEHTLVVLGGRSAEVGFRGSQAIGGITIARPHGQDLAIAKRRVFRSLMGVKEQSQAVAGVDLVVAGRTGVHELAHKLLQLESQLGAVAGQRDGPHTSLAVVRVSRHDFHQTLQLLIGVADFAEAHRRLEWLASLGKEAGRLLDMAQPKGQRRGV